MYMNKYIKNLTGIGITVLLLSAGAFLIFYVFLKSSLPSYSGYIQTNGIKNEVEIYRDYNGVPFVFAENRNDMYFALGYIHAQERLFQMDLLRRSAQGKLSEVFGEKTLSYDLMLRRMGFIYSAYNQYTQTQEEVKECLRNYSAGINEYIKYNSTKLGIEFDLAGYTPDFWKPEHSFLIVNFFYWLNCGIEEKYTEQRLVSQLGHSKTSSILPDVSFDSLSIDLLEKIRQKIFIPDKKFRHFTGYKCRKNYTDIIIIPAEKSILNKPMLAFSFISDFSIPAPLYFVSLNLTGKKTSGFTFPGFPFVLAGTNRNIAWAYKNPETLNCLMRYVKIDSNCIKSFSRRIIREKIKISGKEPVLVNIYREGNKILFPLTEEINIDGKLNSAVEFIEIDFLLPDLAFSSKTLLNLFDSTEKSTLLTDIENIKDFIIAGKEEQISRKDTIPEKINKTVKVDNQSVLNNEITIQSLINERKKFLIDNRQKFSIQDLINIQNDSYSEFVNVVRPYLINAFEGIKIKNRNLNEALKIITQWNCYYEKHEHAAVIFEVFIRQLSKYTFEDEMGGWLYREFIKSKENYHNSLIRILNSGNVEWFDNISTQEFESREKIFRQAFVSALDTLENKLGTNIYRWQWGNLNRVFFDRKFFSNNFMVNKFVESHNYSINGSSSTINNSGSYMITSYQPQYGVTAKFICDFFEPDKIFYILSTGQSGHILSDNYSNMSATWSGSELHFINTSKNFVKSANFDRLLLEKK